LIRITGIIHPNLCEKNIQMLKGKGTFVIKFAGFNDLSADLRLSSDELQNLNKYYITKIEQKRAIAVSIKFLFKSIQHYQKVKDFLIKDVFFSAEYNYLVNYLLYGNREGNIADFVDKKFFLQILEDFLKSDDERSIDIFCQTLDRSIFKNPFGCFLYRLGLFLSYNKTTNL